MSKIENLNSIKKVSYMKLEENGEFTVRAKVTQNVLEVIAADDRERLFEVMEGLEVIPHGWNIYTAQEEGFLTHAETLVSIGRGTKTHSARVFYREITKRGRKENYIWALFSLCGSFKWNSSYNFDGTVVEPTFENVTCSKCIRDMKKYK